MQKFGIECVMVSFCNLGQENELHHQQMKITPKRGLSCRNSQSPVFVENKEAFSWEGFSVSLALLKELKEVTKSLGKRVVMQICCKNSTIPSRQIPR